VSETTADLSTVIAQFGALVDRALKDNQPNLVSNEDLSRILRDAVRLYAFKADKAGQYVPPYANGAVTATETVVAATGIIRAADMNLWDLAMWFNRVGSAPIDQSGGREG
jgi:hypothetical protein